MGAVPFHRANAALDRKRSIPATSPTIFAAESSPQPGKASNVGTIFRTRRPISCASSFTRWFNARQRATSSRAMSATVPINGPSRVSNTVSIGSLRKLLRGILEAREELVQMPTQSALQPSSLGDEILAMVDQEAYLTSCAVQLSDWHIRLAKECSSHRQRVNRVRLASFTTTAPRPRHQLGWHPHDGFARSEQVGFEQARHMPAIFDCELALGPACCPGDRLQVAIPCGIYRSITKFAADLIDRDEGVRSFVRVDANDDHSHAPCAVHSSIEMDRAGTRLYPGRSQTPLKSRRAVRVPCGRRFKEKPQVKPGQRKSEPTHKA
jgi:hypothetical protein